jgi:hypothetical protein
MRAWVGGIGVAALGPVVFGAIEAVRPLPGDTFWIAAPFGLIPLTGVTVGLAMRRLAPVRRRPIAAALSVPVGLGVGWIAALLLSIPLDPSQQAAQTLFFALLSTYVLPWWVGPLLLAMGIAWFIARQTGEQYV